MGLRHLQLKDNIYELLLLEGGLLLREIMCALKNLGHHSRTYGSLHRYVFISFCVSASIYRHVPEDL